MTTVCFKTFRPSRNICQPVASAVNYTKALILLLSLTGLPQIGCDYWVNVTSPDYYSWAKLIKFINCPPYISDDMKQVNNLRQEVGSRSIWLRDACWYNHLPGGSAIMRIFTFLLISQELDGIEWKSFCNGHVDFFFFFSTLTITRTINKWAPMIIDNSWESNQ